jgi:hypothetical protein
LTDSEAEHELALNAALGPRDLAALRETDQVLNGALRASLLQTTDEISHTLARLLA